MADGVLMLKSLHGWLAESCGIYTLRELGWYSFLKGGAPETDDARILGAAAIFHLLVDDTGTQVHHDDSAIYGVLGFVESKRGGSYPTRISGGLVKILGTSPVTRTAVQDWFLQTFP